MDGCSFKPNIKTEYDQGKGKGKGNSKKTKNINGYNKIVNRIRTAAKDKEKIKEKIDR